MKYTDLPNKHDNNPKWDEYIKKEKVSQPQRIDWMVMSPKDYKKN